MKNGRNMAEGYVWRLYLKTLSEDQGGKDTRECSTVVGVRHGCGAEVEIICQEVLVSVG